MALALWHSSLTNRQQKKRVEDLAKKLLKEEEWPVGLQELLDRFYGYWKGKRSHKPFQYGPYKNPRADQITTKSLQAALVSLKYDQEAEKPQAEEVEQVGLFDLYEGGLLYAQQMRVIDWLMSRGGSEDRFRYFFQALKTPSYEPPPTYIIDQIDKYEQYQKVFFDLKDEEDFYKNMPE